jgi:hypothetical protein
MGSEQQEKKKHQMLIETLHHFWVNYIVHGLTC